MVLLNPLWRRPDQEEKLLEKIESHYYRNEGFFIAKAARESMFLDPYTFVYGEIAAHGLRELLQRAQPMAGDVFYDLGSGSGKAVMTAALLYPQILAKGIEYLPEMCDLSQRLSKTLLASLDIPDQQMHFIHGDLNVSDLSDASVVFINATGFFDASYQALVETLSRLRSGTRIIIASKKLPENLFHQQAYFPEIPMNWGNSQSYLYTRL